MVPRPGNNGGDRDSGFPAVIILKKILCFIGRIVSGAAGTCKARLSFEPDSNGQTEARISTNRECIGVREEEVAAGLACRKSKPKAKPLPHPLDGTRSPVLECRRLRGAVTDN
jgi:hypothetical protein